MSRFHLTVCGVCFGLAGAASAEIIDLGGGWQAELFSDNVSLESFGAVDGVLTIEKTATFTEIDEFTGEPKPINIVFSQIADDANTASTIIIASESLTNMTGLNWTDFEFLLVDSGNATWNQADMADLDIAPFASDEYLDANTIYRTFDGVVPDGATWNPGAAAGEFVININLSGDNPLVFSLKEAPSIPAPASIAVVGLLGLGATRRRR